MTMLLEIGGAGLLLIGVGVVGYLVGFRDGFVAGHLGDSPYDRKLP